MRASGAGERQTDGVSVVGGERPPPGPSECGRTASSLTSSAGISPVGTLNGSYLLTGGSLRGFNVLELKNC